jgi:hypothetical protein
MFGVFQLGVAVIVLSVPRLVRLTPMQPMRFLHLIYMFMALIGGSLLGRYVLKSRAWRWAIFLTIVNAGMFIPQRVMFAASPHLEVPGRRTGNRWLQAFDWVRTNTPTDAYFALDPYYLDAPGEDYHSFRALAERSQLADAVKDAAVVTQVPRLAPEWARQIQAQAGWRSFQFSDYERLKSQLGVDWVLVSYPSQSGLDCRWHNESLLVCRIP